ncbi:Spectrin beta chain [Schistosoma japonicum]|nr:Spectrin beta chain [Schistosoma japonicum]
MINRFQIDMNQLVVWIDSVQNLLYMLDTTDNQQFNGNLPRFYLQMNLVNSLQSIQLYYSYLDKKLMEISQWNTAVESIEVIESQQNTNVYDRHFLPRQRTPVIIIKPNEDTQHDLNSNKERERLPTKSLTVDKQIVINSTSRQMDHVS